jgi:hypothetical protein
MVRPGVVQPDPAQSELDLQRDPALAALLGGEDRPIIGEHAGRDAPPAEGGGEGVDHLRAKGDAASFSGDVDPGVVGRFLPTVATLPRSWGLCCRRLVV